MFTFWKARIVALTILLLSTQSLAHAALLEGEQVFARLEHLDTPGSPLVGDQSGFVVVGPGLEVDDLGDSILLQNPVIVDMDFSDTQIVITAVNDQPVAHRELLEFSIGAFGDPAPRVRFFLNPATNWAGFQAGAFQPNLGAILQSVDIVLTGSTALAGQQIVIDVVPEPAAAALLAVTCPALVTAHRRRRGHA